MRDSSPPPIPHWSDQLVLWFGRGFGSGLVWVAPGTFGTLAAFPLIWLLKLAAGEGPFSLLIYYAVAVAYFLIGIPVCRRCERLLGKADPGEIVIDEIAAMLLLFGSLELNVMNIVVSFAFFRLFDIKKPWPVSWADQRKDPLGIMLDDILAALYAFACVWLTQRFIGLEFFERFSLF
ncbi:MAG: phosphatidylglycerophosphatase A [Planctomycetaceae bacterium]|nr:phosphatidylglycerophosphatase A [Planctomycetaceae bacterium]